MQVGQQEDDQHDDQQDADDRPDGVVATAHDCLPESVPTASPACPVIPEEVVAGTKAAVSLIRQRARGTGHHTLESAP